MSKTSMLELDFYVSWTIGQCWKVTQQFITKTIQFCTTLNQGGGEQGKKDVKNASLPNGLSPIAAEIRETYAKVLCTHAGLYFYFITMWFLNWVQRKGLFIIKFNKVYKIYITSDTYFLLD